MADFHYTFIDLDPTRGNCIWTSRRIKLKIMTKYSLSESPAEEMLQLGMLDTRIVCFQRLFLVPSNSLEKARQIEGGWHITNLPGENFEFRAV